MDVTEAELMALRDALRMWFWVLFSRHGGPDKPLTDMSAAFWDRHIDAVSDRATTE